MSKSKKVAQAQAARQAARLEAQRIKVAQQRRERNRRLALIGGLAGIVAAVAVVVALVVVNQQRQDDLAAAAPTGSSDYPSKPAGATSTGGILLGRDLVPGGEAPDPATTVTVEVNSDFICPYCKAFEDQYRAQLEELAQEGKIRLVIRPMAYLVGKNDHSTTEYSGRSGNDAYTVAAGDPAHFVAFADLLWENQPAQGGPGLSDDELAALAREAGVTEDVISRFTDQPLKEYVAWATSLAAAQSGWEGTPDIRFSYGSEESPESQPWNWGAQPSLDKAIESAKNGCSPNGCPDPAPSGD
jgi:protein-disulfide isomerase